MHVDSREYQARLEPRLFAHPDVDVPRFLAFLAKLDAETALSARGWRAVFFVRELFDTPERDFASIHSKLRARSYADRVDFTFKMTSPDRYAAAEARVESSDRSARLKLEEGIYALHSTFSRQATVRRPPGTRYRAVCEWARVFPGAMGVADLEAPTPSISCRMVRRIKGIELTFGRRSVPAMIDIAYPDDRGAAPRGGADGVPEKVEFSWKHRHKREGFRAEDARRMRRLLQALNQTEWVDPTVHLAKARVDSVSALPLAPSADRQIRGAEERTAP